MRRKGLVDDHQWNELLYLFGWIGRREAMREVWHATRDAYDEGFRTLMDGYVGPREG